MKEIGVIAMCIVAAVVVSAGFGLYSEHVNTAELDAKLEAVNKWQAYEKSQWSKNHP